MFYEAINCYDQGLRQDPYNTLLRVKKGNALCRLACVSKAIDCYYNATTQAGAFEMLAVYVRDNYKNLGRNLKKLQQTLKSKYNLPFYQKQLKIFLVSIKNQMRDIIEQQEFEEFEKKMPFKRFVLLADYIETFIKHYGKDYKNHIPRFHQYLLYKHYNITRSELEGRIRKQKKIMERPRWRQKNSIDLMTGKEFEEFLANLFHQKGYKTTVTQPSYDKGCDILLELYGKKR